MWAKYSKNHNTSVTGMLPYCVPHLEEMKCKYYVDIRNMILSICKLIMHLHKLILKQFVKKN